MFSFTHYIDECDKHTDAVQILHRSSSRPGWKEKQWSLLADFLLTGGWLSASSRHFELAVSSLMVFNPRWALGGGNELMLTSSFAWDNIGGNLESLCCRLYPERSITASFWNFIYFLIERCSWLWYLSVGTRDWRNISAFCILGVKSTFPLSNTCKKWISKFY